MKIGSVRARVGEQVHRDLAAAARFAGLLLACAALTAPAAAQSASAPVAAGASARSAFRPSAIFVQAGVAEEAQMANAGAIWEWSWHRDLSFGRLSGYWEAAFGRWSSDVDGNGGNAWVTQIGVTPVLRLYPRSWGGRWFLEGGIGFNFLQPIYRSASKSFSTTFNFGDHLAVGRRFGRDRRHELALRFQHFSNAGIRSPNPGEDFLQLRYSWYF